MKKIILIIFAALFSLALLTGCGSQKKIKGYDCGCSNTEKPSADEAGYHG